MEIMNLGIRLCLKLFTCSSTFAFYDHIYLFSHRLYDPVSYTWLEYYAYLLCAINKLLKCLSLNRVFERFLV